MNLLNHPSSEDIVIIKRAFEEIEIGHIQTVTGAGGGVIFTPSISSHDAKEMVEDLRAKLSESDRILPGGYIYLSDLLSTPAILKNIGRIIAKSFMDQKIDAVMTVATKGVPLANAVANVLNVPFVIVRRDLKITEGSTVSVNYVSGSSGDRIEKNVFFQNVVSRQAAVSWLWMTSWKAEELSTGWLVSCASSIQNWQV